MATTTTANDDRVLATVQQIVQTLNPEVQEDMLLIFSSFDKRLANISSLIKEESSSLNSRFEAAEKLICRDDTSFQESPDEYLTAVDEIVDLLDDLSLRSNNGLSDRAECAVQVAMSRFEDEFRHILIANTVPLDAGKLYGSIRRTSISNDGDGGDDGVGDDDDIDGDGFRGFSESGRSSECFHERGVSLCGDDLCVDLINSEAVEDLKKIAERMMRCKYERECVQVYCNVRRDGLDECLGILGFEKLSIEEVQKIDWSPLDEKMKKWIQALKICVRILLTGEKRLCDYIFSGSDSAKVACFNETAKGCVMQLLNFGEAVSIVRRSSEKLFRILDMYDTLADVLPDLKLMVTDEFVCSEAEAVLTGLGQAAKGTFVEFENAVKGESSKKPTHNGEIHPLIRYVMNYVKLLVDYGDTLNSLLENDKDDFDDLQSDDLESTTPIQRRLLALLATLESNLEEKSRLYDDDALRYVFLMSNILYIVQKVKDSELIKLVGDQWVRKRRGRIRQYATAYLRAAWSRVLSCLRDEGIGGSSNNASKVALKDRFKNFNACFEDIYRSQTSWRVPDPQLRVELRISISEMVLPAYRAFLGRFGSQLESGRHAGKYIKYTADDLENYLLDLFEGTPLVLHHLRRKSS